LARYLREGERSTVGLLLAGDRVARDWRTGRAQPFDAFEAKAEALALLAAAGARVDNLQVLGGASPFYHPGRSARLCLGPKNVLAEFGELHPATLRAFDLGGTAVAAEIFLDAIPAKRAAGRMREAYTPPALQAVKRGLRLPGACGDPGRCVAARGAWGGQSSITGVSLFDLFTGPGVPEAEVARGRSYAATGREELRS
jgi:phenylalanyl-tRNA synthetase beta chain